MLHLFNQIMIRYLKGTPFEEAKIIHLKNLLEDDLTTGVFGSSLISVLDS